MWLAVGTGCVLRQPKMRSMSFYGRSERIMAINIALDGPSGAGKSTIARRAAEKLGYVYVDTGAMYRSIAYHALQNGADLGDAEQITAQLDGLKIELTYIDGAQAVLVNGENVSDKIRTPEVSMGA